MQNSYFYLIKTAWQFAGKRRFHFVLSYLLFICANVISMLEPMIFALFINNIQRGGEHVMRDAIFYLAIYASLPLFIWMFHGTSRVIERVNSFHIVANFKENLFEILASLPLKWHKDHHSGSTMSRVEKATAALRGFTDEGFMYVETVVRFLASLVAIFILLPVAGFVALGFSVLIFLIIFAFNKVLLNNVKLINEAKHSADAVFYDYVANIATVITLRLEKLAKNEVVQKIVKIFPVWKRNAALNETKWFAISMGLAIFNFIVLFLYLYQKISTGEVILIGSLVALYEYVQRFINVFFDMTWKYENLLWYATDIRTCDGIRNQEIGLAVGGEIVAGDWQRIRIGGLFFKYEDEQHHEHNLSEVSVELRRGAKIAFIGESGSGKSTMMSLIRGLEKADKVNVEVDGREFDSLRVLSGLVTLMPQQPEIFENTIGYNITAGIPHEKAEILKACEMACFSNVLKRLPRGLKTNIKERGVNLSGGEKQRLALARGIFAAELSSIVLLDEPTSSVDPRNETKIYENLFREFADKCLISSIHRLHLLPKFDFIYIFENGELVDCGSFEGLLKSSEVFQGIWGSYKKSLER